MQEGGNFSLVFDCVGFELNPQYYRQSGFITPDNAVFWLEVGDTTWSSHEDLALMVGSGAREDTWAVR